MTIKEAIKEYQCPGCVNGPFPDCFENNTGYDQCDNHHAGTMISGIGSIFLGMPNGFNRKGSCESTKIWLFESFETSHWTYDKFNIPIWKHLDPFGNTIVKGICPRLNNIWIHIFLGDCIDKIECINLLQAEIDDMD
uniref:Uncharacterized protein n=1 Tax=viral metagenome TaxID=1070528 RepID=A0A6H1ZVK0_9ZZZZ